MTSHIRQDVHDPVAVCIQNFLQRQAAADQVRWRVSAEEKAGVRVDFGDHSIVAENADIAVIRLGRVLMDDPRFGAALSMALVTSSEVSVERQKHHAIA